MPPQSLGQRDRQTDKHSQVLAQLEVENIQVYCVKNELPLFLFQVIIFSFFLFFFTKKCLLCFLFFTWGHQTAWYKWVKMDIIMSHENYLKIFNHTTPRCLIYLIFSLLCNGLLFSNFPSIPLYQTPYNQAQNSTLFQI